MFASVAAATEADREPNDYLNICFGASTSAEFEKTLLIEEGWRRVELQEAPENFDWESISALTPEKLVLIANSSIGKIGSGSSTRSVQNNLEFFRNELTFERQIFPIYPREEYLIFYHDLKRRVIAIRATHGKFRKKCYYAAFGFSKAETLFDRFSEAGEQFGSIDATSKSQRIHPELNESDASGSIFFVSEKLMNRLFGFEFGNLVVVRIRK